MCFIRNTERVTKIPFQLATTLQTFKIFNIPITGLLTTWGMLIIQPERCTPSSGSLCLAVRTKQNEYLASCRITVHFEIVCYGNNNKRYTRNVVREYEIRSVPCKVSEFRVCSDLFLRWNMLILLRNFRRDVHSSHCASFAEIW